MILLRQSILTLGAALTLIGCCASAVDAQRGKSRGRKVVASPRGAGDSGGSGSDKSGGDNAASSTAKCTLTRAPELRGLNLGMTLADVRRTFPSIDRNPLALIPDKNGFIKPVAVLPALDNKGKTYAGVRSVGFQFLDEKVFSIVFLYEDETLRNVDELAAKVSESLKLPARWQKIEYLQTERQMECRGFKVAVEAGGETSPSLAISDTKAAELLAQRKEEEEKKQKAADEKERKQSDFRP